MKDMKSILSIVQATYPGADGKIVSKVVKNIVPPVPSVKEWKKSQAILLFSTKTLNK